MTNLFADRQAQNLETHHGPVLRLTEEGKPAPDNPKLGRRPENGLLLRIEAEK